MLKVSGVTLPLWRKWISKIVLTCFYATARPSQGGMRKARQQGCGVGKVLDVRQAYNWRMDWFSCCQAD